MPEQSKKRIPRPRDVNQRAFQIVQEATGQAPKFTPGEATEEDLRKNPHAVALGRLGGMKGGPARAAKLSPRKRSQIAAKAAKARWGKRAPK
ncbi:MAG: hypothetical protein LAO04_21935 [Acidobacteriia bacterium]|nr:hypothetical protein [Terriglobia bacterium]